MLIFSGKKNRSLHNKAYPSKQGNAGFTLIELLIAIAVFTVGIMASFTLALANMRVAKDNFDRVLAANLAREGIELIRSVRDSNWLMIDSNEDCDDTIAGIQLCNWDQRLNAGDHHYVDYNLSYAGYGVWDNFSSIGCSDTIEACLSICGDACRLKVDVNGGSSFYRHSIGNDSNAWRIIRIENICLDETIIPGPDESFEMGNCQVGHVTVGKKVTSRVRWLRYGSTKNLDVVEYFYNWRR